LGRRRCQRHDDERDAAGEYGRGECELAFHVHPPWSIADEIRSNGTPARAYASSTSSSEPASTTQRNDSSRGTIVERRKCTALPSRSSSATASRTRAAERSSSAVCSPGR